ncbi:hypothetical protein CZ794_03265 [Psychrobacter sp. JB385]|nr:hypothetical protein CZ794_03265 [Psychrobacter sp. JB385]
MKSFIAHIYAYITPLRKALILKALNQQELAAMYSTSFLSRAIKKRTTNCSLISFRTLFYASYPDKNVMKG